jgi:hypothetical protein
MYANAEVERRKAHCHCHSSCYYYCCYCYCCCCRASTNWVVVRRASCDDVKSSGATKVMRSGAMMNDAVQVVEHWAKQELQEQHVNDTVSPKHAVVEHTMKVGRRRIGTTSSREEPMCCFSCVHTCFLKMGCRDGGGVDGDVTNSCGMMKMEMDDAMMTSEVVVVDTMMSRDGDTSRHQSYCDGVMMMTSGGSSRRRGSTDVILLHRQRHQKTMEEGMVVMMEEQQHTPEHGHHHWSVGTEAEVGSMGCGNSSNQKLQQTSKRGGWVV